MGIFVGFPVNVNDLGGYKFVLGSKCTIFPNGIEGDPDDESWDGIRAYIIDKGCFVLGYHIDVFICAQRMEEAKTAVGLSAQILDYSARVTRFMRHHCKVERVKVAYVESESFSVSVDQPLVIIA